MGTGKANVTVTNDPRKTREGEKRKPTLSKSQEREREREKGIGPRKRLFSSPPQSFSLYTTLNHPKKGHSSPPRAAVLTLKGGGRVQEYADTAAHARKPPLSPLAHILVNTQNSGYMSRTTLLCTNTNKPPLP